MADFHWTELAKVGVEAGGFALAILTAWIGLNKAHRDRREALQQAKRDLQWRQTVEAQSSLRRIANDPQARNAMTMLDWNARRFEVREGLREQITWNDMRNALRTESGLFTPKEVFVRESFDALFDQLQMIQQQIANKMFEPSHVIYPLGYYSRRMKHPRNWPAISAYLHKYDYPLAMTLIEGTFKQSDSAADVDIEAADAALRMEEHE